MCRLTDALRWVLDIRPYVWTPPQTYRRSAARGAGATNGHAPRGIYWTTHGMTPRESKALYELDRDHRVIRQIVADVARHRTGEGT